MRLPSGRDALSTLCRFVKDFSAADIALSYLIENISSMFGISAYPKLAEWLTTINERPAYKRALEKGGPYET